MSNRAAVFGGAGFVGSHMVDRLLCRGYDVTVLDDFSSGTTTNLAHHASNLNLHVKEADLSDNWTISGTMDIVFNFASPASPPHYARRPLATLRANSTGVWRTVDYATSRGARLVHASTSEIYGDPQTTPQDELYRGNVDPVSPRSVYDESKRFAESLIGAYTRDCDLDAGIVRIFNTYGPRLRADDGRVISNFVYQAFQNEPLTVYGDGRQTRSFCYIDDLTDAIMRMAITPGIFGPINVGRPEEISIRALADHVLRATGRQPSDISFGPLPTDDPAVRRPNVTRAKRLLGWEPTTSLTDGLITTVDWCRSNPSWMRGSSTDHKPSQLHCRSRRTVGTDPGGLHD